MNKDRPNPERGNLMRSPRPPCSALRDRVEAKLCELRARDLERSTRAVPKSDRALVNLISNDCLGIAANADDTADFLETLRTAPESLRLGSGASRLLSGSFEAHDALEDEIARRFGRPDGVLLFQSGWHANTGLLPALAKLGGKTAFLADRDIHASFIDGFAPARAEGATVQRFAHNDTAHLEHFLAKLSATHDVLWIVTESLFSMSGDVAPLKELVRLRERYPKAALILDEAHAFGAYGPTGLGLAEAYGILDAVDIVIGTFGKALGTAGAFAAASPELRSWLASTHRPSIYSTAMPPILAAKTLRTLERLDRSADRRRRLAHISNTVRDALNISGEPTHIVPIPFERISEMRAAHAALKEAGFLTAAVRPPTVRVPQLRLSLHADLTDDEIEGLLHAIEPFRQERP